MTIKRIRQLLAMLPASSTYITHIQDPEQGLSKYGTDRDVDIWAYTRNDPVFGAMFVKSFWDAGLSLPAEVTEANLWHLYAFKSLGDKSNVDVLEACALTNHHQRIARTIIECLLMHPFIKIKSISALIGYSPKTITLYHDLFFNVRDRMLVDHDEAYILQLVYPESRQVEFTHNYHIAEDWTWIARRITYNYGLTALFQWLGGKPMDSETCGAEAAKAFESRIMSAGRYAMNLGFHHQHGMVAINNAKSIVQSSKLGGQDVSTDDMTKGLTRLSMDEGLMATFYETVTGDAFKRLDAQQLMRTPVADLLKQKSMSV